MQKVRKPYRLFVGTISNPVLCHELATLTGHTYRVLYFVQLYEYYSRTTGWAASPCGQTIHLSLKQTNNAKAISGILQKVMVYLHSHTLSSAQKR